MSNVSIDPVLIVGLLALALALVVVLLRTLLADPAPAFFGGSIRRAARRMLRPATRRTRWKMALERIAGVIKGLRWWILPPLAAGVLALQFSITWGPLADAEESTTFLDTVWVVVAASLGLSVAMVAFAFQAFMSSGQQIHGGTLREFADETGLLDAISLGVLTLVITGMVRLHIGHDSPAGWGAAWATFLSAATLFAVPIVVRRVVVSLDERRLLRMRAQRLKATVDRAMLYQLTKQAAEVVLEHTRMPVTRSILSPDDGVALNASSAGEVKDISLGRLARAIARRRRNGHELSCQLVVSLGDRPDTGEPLLWLRGPTSEHPPRGVRRAVRFRRGIAERPDHILLDQLSQLHRQALEAARVGLTERWRQIAESYELVLLALPPAAATFQVPFAGAIAEPGFFGVGPLQRIRDYLYDEITVAVKNENSELVDAISYFPAHLATRAVAIGAPAIATTMLALYPAMYRLAQGGLQ